MEGFPLPVNEIKIQSSRRKYSVFFVEDHFEKLKQIYTEGDVFIIDENIANLYPDLYRFIKPFKHIFVTANDAAKNFSELDRYINFLIKKDFSKKNRLIAIGGGVTQDITAFIASILFRGVDWLFFPTTLLAQCDSCIGSKSSVNFGRFKNQLGTYYPPVNIFIDIAFLKTLSSVELNSGLGEMLHYFLVNGEEDLAFAEKHTAAMLDYDALILTQFISRSLKIKKKIIEKDEFESGPRLIFNYGHSFGHAIEAATNYQIPHGIAVAVGMDLANLLSVELDFLPLTLRNRIQKTLFKVYREFSFPNIDFDLFVSALRKDKKNIGSKVRVILTMGIGEMFVATLPDSKEIDNLIQNFFLDVVYRKQL